mmetsp:Transcript_26815/g.42051  ORF Transcript_26815/g.42051 Transcript_26815/m.42051 type:complete len:287 (+) Transcript_26815:255-1115(+)
MYAAHEHKSYLCSHLFVQPADLLRNGEPQTSPAELTQGCVRWLKASSSFLYVELSSLVLLFACVALLQKLQWYSTAWIKYAISVASVSFGICLILQTMEFLKPGFLQKPVVGEHSSEKLCSVFLLLWWIFGTGFITFKAPFIVTSNGWFGAWGGLISSCQWCIGLDFGSYNSQSREVKYLLNLVFCSIVAILASISPLRTEYYVYVAGAGLSIAAAAITLIGCAYLIGMYNDISKNVVKLTSILLFLLWVVTAGVCTYMGPFVRTGNGFFAVWLSALCALKIATIE